MTGLHGYSNGAEQLCRGLEILVQPRWPCFEAGGCGNEQERRRWEAREAGVRQVPLPHELR